ncbi:MAG: HpaII family restriction endonuclease [Bacteroidaceae bacterium]|nr:HpaII family restriction endonuclease [Bacteroidaceae bacterium]
MAFEASKREWSELYAFFRLLSDGCIAAGTPEGTADGQRVMKVALVQREEHDGTRQYIIEENDIHLKGENIDKRLPREDFGAVAQLVYEAIRSAAGESEVTSPDGVEEFLDEAAIYNLEAKTDDRTDFYVAFWSTEAPLVGFRSYSRLGGMLPLLDGGRAANLKFEQTGVRFPGPAINKINMLESPNEVLDRMMMIERLGGILKFNDVADKIFRSNLLMIDLHFPRLMAEMVRVMYYEDITRIKDLTERIEEINPLKVKTEIITKHRFYQFKVKQFLMALAMGMRPAKLYNGTDSAVEGFVYTDSDGRIVCYQKADRQSFEEFLYNHTRLEKGPLEKDKYGYLERENNLFYFKLNLKIGFIKRFKTNS